MLVITVLFRKSFSYLKRVRAGSIQNLARAEWEECCLVNLHAQMCDGGGGGSGRGGGGGLFLTHNKDT